MRALPLLVLLALACNPAAGPPAPETPPSVRTGAEVLARQAFRPLDGLRVGLIVNHTARVDTTHLIDLLHAAPNVTLGALFGPEHGLRGEADAGEKIEDGRDARTGVPVYSLYGETRRPTPAMLAGLDALVFDIQDVGARFYTYISTMGLAMQAAAEAGLPFFVLDRPNPLGGLRVEGFVLEAGFTSFVGQYPIPIVHGLTVGELARMIRGERMLPGLDSLDLRVIPMDGWQRTMTWPATGRPWLPPSPNIPDFETALIYPGTCFIEGTTASEGRGTRQPFKQIGAPWADARALADTLNARHLPGVRFEPVTFTPVSIDGMATNPKHRDVPVHGVRYVLTDPATFQPVTTGLHVLEALYRQAPDDVRGDFLNARWLNLLAGTDRLHAMLTAGTPATAIAASWTDEVEAFRTRRATYLLYD
ncbi:DUF1343 domain-containing protein [Rhodocaloribacter litoris]|uniref:exo-beta-N-acetylmuramidase NamZ family protein n=1 Tax=Rhodocaloribacter litoris TaxID=2558931 RepID=UPI00141DCF5B|nr:DUF1343 domain-containing protein [Rhodocaloribacter litoris]QXD16107.1 DUF1343 domain-containing protein [Rhodocaloribacter litoris]GIV59841.1 MAG: hypothetical protein KatS3mg043_0930 [Rhodothermaceae bacterium]